MRNSLRRARAKLTSKYAYDTSGYDKYVINDIIKNRPTHLTSVFKEYLVFDEPIEFLKRKYTVKECEFKLRKLTEFHTMYFKVFPNFILVPEKHYMYKNIERKQRVIDDQQYRALLKQQHYQNYGIDDSNFTKLFDESYLKQCSNFKLEFEKEDINIKKLDFDALFKPRKMSMSSSYCKNSDLITKKIKRESSIEAVLSKVDTSCMQSDQFDADSATSLSF